jgi:hypothetical protein
MCIACFLGRAQEKDEGGRMKDEEDFTAEGTEAGGDQKLQNAACNA